MLLTKLDSQIQQISVFADAIFDVGLVGVAQQIAKHRLFARYILLHSLEHPEDVVQQFDHLDLLHVGDVFDLGAETLHAHIHRLFRVTGTIAVSDVDLVAVGHFEQLHAQFH